MNDLKDIYENRRSGNFFDKSKNLDQKTLEDIINLASLTPSAFNLQPWEIIAVKSIEAKNKLYNLSYKQPKILEASVVLMLIGDRNGYNSTNLSWKYLEESTGGNKAKILDMQKMAYTLYGSRYERGIKFAESHIGMLAMSIMYSAKYYGVDSHPMSGIEFDEINEAFNFSIDKDISMLICLGYFDETKTLSPRLGRKQYSEFVKEI